MSERVKISELLKDSSSSSEGDISVKEILEIIKAVKELAQMKNNQQEMMTTYHDNVRQMQNIQQNVQQRVEQKVEQKPNAEKVYNQFMQALEQLSLLYGEDISVKEFKQKLKDDKDNLIKMIEGAVNDRHKQEN